ncbi:hypothetical protein [Sulfitobacter sp. EE-36]|uniref:hypothetical protein n=1 Tax=Sulfitobacter TaxID=60136 RepID=UPI000066AF2D|nr:hypothetical protein [Sulfitobacter sp. EE-36]EAP83964.1 hypothetical protein EE36_12898 [Sulfitobacter sp. EE-36]
MAESNDDQAAKLIESLSGKMVEAILPKIAESVEAQIQGVVKKNDELLDELKQKKSVDELEATKKLLAGLEAKQQQEQTDKNGLMQFGSEGQNIKLSKADARDPVKYRSAKKLAADRGVDLEIVRDE